MYRWLDGRLPTNLDGVRMVLRQDGSIELPQLFNKITETVQPSNIQNWLCSQLFCVYKWYTPAFNDHQAFNWSWIVLKEGI